MVEVTDYRALISGQSWYRFETVGKPVILTYSFETATPTYFSKENPNAVPTFSPLSEAEKSVVRTALDGWASVSGVQFFETTRHQGDVTFAFYDTTKLANYSGEALAGLGGFPAPFSYKNDTGDGVYNGETLGGGDVWFDSTYRQSSTFASDFKHVALHEIGHALGLKHSFEAEPGHEEVLTAAADTGNNTVMSYDQSVRASQLGPLDVDAIQFLYGGPGGDGTQYSFVRWDQAAERLEINGNASAEMLRGTGADDVIRSMGGRDLIYTAQGRDLIILEGQAAQVNGGEGFDKVVTGLDQSARNSLGGTGDFRYIGVGNDSQIYIDIERLAFSGGTLAFDTDYLENAGVAYRTYQAAFNRAPDLEGLSFQINNLDRGLSFVDMANGFIASSEFSNVYGSDVSNAGYVDRLYQNVLGRPGEASGVQFWTDTLDSGAGQKADVLVGFAESAENITLTGSSTQGGVWFLEGSA